MKRQILTLLALCAAAFSLSAQSNWAQVERLMAEGSYKTAYGKAEMVYADSKAAGRQRLTAAYYMAQAAAYWQEEARDSAVLRYRALLPVLVGVDKALCHAFLGEWDSALVHEEELKRTPVEEIKPFVDGDKGLNVTPTAYDVVVMRMQEDTTLRQRVELQRRLCAFHSGDNKDIRLWHDLRLLDFMEQVPNVRLTDDTVLAYIARHRSGGSQYITGLYGKMAQRCMERGEMVQAVAWCDSAIALYPKSQWGVVCANMRSDITAPEIDIAREPHFVAPHSHGLLGVTYRNVRRLHLRLVKEPEGYMGEDKLAKLKPVREWSMELPQRDDYGEQTACFAVEPLPAGKYRLLAAPTKEFGKGLASQELHVTDMVLHYTTDGRGIMVDRTTGSPIAGQRISLVAPKIYGRQGERVIQSVVTGADGCYRFDSVPPLHSILRAERGGYMLEQSVYSHRGETDADRWHRELKTVTDRPIYRAGDTVQAAFTLYRTDGREGALLSEGHEFRVLLRDPKGKEVQRLTLTTDDFGSAHCSQPLPADALGGQWALDAEDGSGSWTTTLRVEEYRQPKFMVELGVGSEELGAAPSFGVPYTVRGRAASYSGVPVGGARVRYKVTRSGWMPLRRCWDHFVETTDVAEGEVTTEADGSFVVVFTPLPDSNMELSMRPTFSYSTKVTVTDLNGESHDAGCTMRVGYRRLFLAASGVEAEMRELKGIGVSLTDIDGRRQKGEVKAVVERLRRPEPLRLVPEALTHGAEVLVDSADYARLFPYYIYDRTENDRDRWEVEWRWTATTDSTAIALPPMQGGIYRVVLSALDGTDTVADTVYTVLTPPADHRMRGADALWVDCDKDTAHPGGNVTFRIGSAYNGMKVWYRVEYGHAEQLVAGWLTMDDRLQKISVDVDSAMLGGLTLTLMGVLHGQVFTVQRTVEVPFSHMELKVDIATFRDKLLPGATEEWTVSVKSYGLGVRSALVMTMYDDALNSYGGKMSWSIAPWTKHTAGNWQLYEPYFSHGGRMYKLAAVNSIEVLEDQVYADAAKVQASGSVEPAGTEPQVRMNLNTLAFFAPALRTDENGAVTYRFTVPELLTRWNVRALAVTRDLKTGTLDRTLVTQKPLMVQPNMPRFLRQGDSLALMAKVVLNEELRTKNIELPVEVSLMLTDAATGDTICYHTEPVMLKDAAQLMFPVEVPQGVNTVIYRIVARADSMSDGEQGQLPVLSNRETVTLSQALYINGVGEKSFAFPQEAFVSNTATLQRITAELTGSPIWLALKALPHMKELDNPSTLYLAEQVGVNRIVLEVAEKVDVSSVVSVDSIRRHNDRLVAQLTERQNADGGWSWMPEGESSLWVTQQVLKHFADKKALAFVDREVQRDYERNVKPYAKKYKWQPVDIDYLYMRSMYGKASTEAYRFYYANALKHYKDYESLYTQAQLALIFHRHGDSKAALDLLRRLTEKAIKSDEMGLYWRDNRSGWCWWQRPIETQALLIQAFTEAAPHDSHTVGLMQQWLLKQKQTTHWGNDRATAEAIRALMVNNLDTTTSQPQLTLFGTPMTTEVQGREGYRTQTWTGAELDTLPSHHSSLITLRKQDDGIAWGAVYCQFEDDIDKLPSSEMGIKIVSSTTPHSSLLTPNYKVGDRVTVRIDIQCDRAMDYLELIDGRPSCLEPVSTRACWRWNDGLSYYYTVNNNDIRCYIEHIEKGRYSIEYEAYVTNPGAFMSGALKMQCLYAPEFRAVAPAHRVEISEK